MSDSDLNVDAGRARSTVGRLSAGSLSLPIGATLLALTVPGLLVLDLANGLLGEGQGIPALPVTPGELGRTVLLFAGAVTLLQLRGPFFLPLQRWVVALLGLGLLGPLTAFASTSDTAVFLHDIEKLFKALYGPLIIAIFLAIYLRYRVRFETVLTMISAWGAIASLNVVLFKYAGVGVATYGKWSSAFKGLFLAQNELGLGMTISLAASSYLALDRPRPRRFIVALATIVGMLILGTRTATLGSIVVPLIVLFTYRGDRVYRRAGRRRIIVGAGVILALVFAGNQLSQRLRTESYQAKKYQRLVSGEFTRVLLLAGAFQYAGERPLTADLIGDGAHRYESGVADALPFKEGRALAEVDWMDLYGAHGVLFTIALYAFYLWLLVRLIPIDRIHGKGAKWTLVLMTGIYLTHATLAGHALASPLPTGIIAPVLAYGWWASRAQRLAFQRRRTTTEVR